MSKIQNLFIKRKEKKQNIERPKEGILHYKELQIKTKSEKKIKKIKLSLGPCLCGIKINYGKAI